MDWLQLLTISSTAGIRAFTPLALTVDANTQSQILYPFMVGEWLYDQYPKATNRTSPWSLLMRTASGATIGMLLEIAYNEKISLCDLVAGAATGGAGAYAMTHISYHLRKYLFEELNIPSSFLGSLEDVIAVFLSSRNVPDIRDRKPVR